uniref:Cytoplasmic tRNA 2-thiolation protein 2 n=1 Tax=Catagonus wagneri TaxID=51154 RepID=A0A8C3WK16_9CETA
MCEVGEDYGEPSPGGLQPPRPGREQKCVKCKEGLPVVVIRAGDAFCRDCFKALYVHKFRAVLGKSRLIFPGEKVLLAWSGGPSSSSMLWQVLQVRLRRPQGAACGQSATDRAKTLAEMKQVLRALGFPWHIVALEEVFGLPPTVLRRPAPAPGPVGTGPAYKAAVDHFLQQRCALGAGREEQLSHPGPREPQSPAVLPTATQTEALCRLFGSVKTLTAKEELLQTLRTHLILHVARTHGYSKVMTGDTCTRLAIKLMTSLALGRGAFLAWDTGFADERHGDVVVVRPMREHTLKEVAFYNRLCAVPSVFTPAVDTKAPEKASIHRLMEAFLLRLQAQFPSTVSTVYRTSEKLLKAPRDGFAAGPPGPRCLLCMCVLDVDSADSATAFGAQTTSHGSPTQPPVPEAGAARGPCCCAWMGRPHSHREDARARVIEQLCYGCRVNLKDLPSLDCLPPYILAEAQLRSQRYLPTLGGLGGGFWVSIPTHLLPPGPGPSGRPRRTWTAMRRPGWVRAEPTGRQEPAGAPSPVCINKNILIRKLQSTWGRSADPRRAGGHGFLPQQHAGPAGPTPSPAST